MQRIIATTPLPTVQVVSQPFSESPSPASYWTASWTGSGENGRNILFHPHLHFLREIIPKRVPIFDELYSSATTPMKPAAATAATAMTPPDAVGRAAAPVAGTEEPEADGDEEESSPPPPPLLLSVWEEVGEAATTPLGKGPPEQADGVGMRPMPGMGWIMSLPTQVVSACSSELWASYQLEAADV